MESLSLGSDTASNPSPMLGQGVSEALPPDLQGMHIVVLFLQYVSLSLSLLFTPPYTFVHSYFRHHTVRGGSYNPVHKTLSLQGRSKCPVAVY